jgi:predicted TIM-barrel fold metal-dependent hydrolase
MKHDDASTVSRVDVHAHYVTSTYRKAAEGAGHAQPDGMPALPQWSVREALESMDRLRIQTAFLSISSPGVHFGDNAAATTLARSVNEEAARARSDHPRRFGVFASLPLPDVDGALKELEYAFDVLKVDGVVLETNHHGVYLGDAKLEPLYAELNKRRGVIFIHPTSPWCSCCEAVSFGYPRPMIEFMFETTRSVTNMILSGALSRHPEISVIVPHAGATLPVLADRIAALTSLVKVSDVTADDVFALLRRLYYDLAGAPVPRLLGALLQIADQKRILYGSDWPFTPNAIAEAFAKKIDATALLDGETRRLIYRDNAWSLFPRLRRL